MLESYIDLDKVYRHTFSLQTLYMIHDTMQMVTIWMVSHCHLHERQDV